VKKHQSLKDILEKLETPSSVLSTEQTLQRTRDPRRRKDMKNQQQPDL